MMERKSKEIMGTVLKGLLDYTVEHFTAEEVLLAKHNYPGLAQQQAMHRTFIEKVKELQAGFDKGSLTLSLDTMNFLKDWLVNHIQGQDKQYESCLNK